MYLKFIKYLFNWSTLYEMYIYKFKKHMYLKTNPIYYKFYSIIILSKNIGIFKCPLDKNVNLSTSCLHTRCLSVKLCYLEDTCVIVIFLFSYTYLVINIYFLILDKIYIKFQSLL